MFNFGKWSLMNKIISVASLTMILLVAILFVLYVREATRAAHQGYVEKARAICLTAESTRDEMEDKWDKGLFTAAQLRSYAEKGDMERVLATVPVVSAWQAAMRKSELGGYTFKVPKFQPRNPKNEPDALETAVLKRLDAKNLDEAYEIDESINSIRYFRSVKLSKTCMLCHGDPATSVSLWGNNKGKDPTGGPLENWNVGERHGAFEVIQKLDAADAAVRSNVKLAGAVALGLILVALAALVCVIMFNVTGPIKEIVAGLNDSAGQVSSAAGQISSLSQNVAEGATAQAASLEETSSALEEMASMTRQNADNAGSANQRMSETQRQVSQGAVAVGNMASAMNEINESSQQIRKIIKTIEEIAFQTNLLALNAAVEAARAGEAGKGFAVVADEVRNLAQRSAQAARDTASLIEGTVTRVKNGAEIAQLLETSFKEIEKSANTVGRLVAEIATACQEQAQGVDQVNTAVAQMDKVTQSNAASSEESASASEELSAQSEHLKMNVENLVALVEGAARHAHDIDLAQHAPVARATYASPHAHTPMPKPKPGGGGKPKSLSGPKPSSIVKPNDVIPLDDDDGF